MTHASAIKPRRSSEFWAIVGSATAIGALILTVSGWQRSDIRELRGEIRSVDSNLRGELASLETNLRSELQAVEDKLSSKIESLQEGQALIGARLAVVESHVLGASSVARSGTGPEVVP